MMPNHKDEIEKLSTAMKEAKSKRAYERYQAIYLHLQGYTKGEIATIIGRSKKTIYNPESVMVGNQLLILVLVLWIYDPYIPFFDDSLHHFHV